MHDSGESNEANSGKCSLMENYSFAKANSKLVF